MPAADLSSGSQRRELLAVMFDMDGLIVDSEPFWFEVECSIMERLGGDWDDRDQAALVGGSLDRSLDYLLAKATRPASREAVGRWMVDGMVALLTTRPVPVLPGALALIAEVAAAGVPYALVTSSERPVMEAVLDSLKITFPVAICGDDVTASKPDPEPYLLATAKLGADPGQSVVLEDSPNGVAAAEAAGCLVVAVPSIVPISPAPGRRVVSSLADLSLAEVREFAALGR
jgi:HAD superfamily hydrolase (TIGR01509 family)